ncbi:RsmB/NOP family class I SAM-dependent RNA methyltransferase [Acidianus sp. HS-5]|uniref:RsmB/NOP family class I SAM-dependent RNA methyltransferase n=1 Tax=Acidianus sp. HS-5 TaxID=2886040 RepID=UPI001F2EC502|nr:RsmB/NOP family class I SAM-dependent RNA methyltransferase [Acidianus sp. HS-5]
MDNRKLFADALFLIMKKSLSPERAFDIAFKKYMQGNRKELYKEFLEYIKKYLYARNVYPGISPREVDMSINPDPMLSFPKWIFERLYALLGEEGIKGIYNHKIWVRVNELKASTDAVIKSLDSEGYKAKRTEIEFLLEIENTDKRVSESAAFKEGLLVPQDKSSVLAVLTLDPKPYDKILEIGSAPGVKSSLIQQLTKDKSYLISIDISENRIIQQKKLMRKWDVSNVELIVADALHLPIRKIDKVFIDAPCSNSGTINVDPSVILRLNKRKINELSSIQVGILREVSKLKTQVVYITCSLFPEEGEKVVERFERNLVNLPNKGHEGYKKSRVWLRVFRTYPHKDFSEGFFIAKLDFSSLR